MKYYNLNEKFNFEVLSLVHLVCSSEVVINKGVCTTLDILNLLSQNDSVRNVLSRAHIDLEKIKNEVKLNLNRNFTKDKVVFSPDLKETLLRSYLISKDFASGKVDLIHLLLASFYSPSILEAMNKLGYSIASLENILSGKEPNQSSPGQSRAVSSAGGVLSRYTDDITKLAREGKLNEIVYRDVELAQLTRILVRQSKNSVIVLGEVGVGKGSIVELLAQRVANGNIADQLQNVKILQLNISTFLSALAGRTFNDLIEVVEEELNSLGEVIVYIKNFEIQSEQAGYEKLIIAHMIKSLINKRQVRFILTMTSSSYKNLSSKETEFSELFETVKISEPNIELAIKIVGKVAERLSNYHNVSINSEVVKSCVELSKRYIQEKFLPSKAIDLLDEACSKAHLEGKTHITVDDIRTIISEKTGIPIEKLTVDEQKKLLDLEKLLNEKVIGQKEAVHAVSEVVRRSRAGLKDPKKPVGSFLFLGPSGVGKTYLAKNLAKIVYDSESAMIRIDMSEFSESHTVQRLIGSPPGYVGYDEGGQLTNPVWEKPYSIILLDEIEKAHPKVFDIFLQVLDEGRLTDGQGRTVDFKNTIIIATSNIASDQILQRMENVQGQLEGFKREKFYEEQILPLLKNHFRPEFINRFDEIVVFNPLSIEVLKIIGKLQIQKVQQRLRDKNIRINISDYKLTEFAKNSYNPAFGARPLIRLIQEKVENVIARKIISGEIKPGDVVNI